MLEITALSRSYGPFKAVDDVSFTIGQGEIVGLLGHNGAGKTTIMKMLSGTLEPDAGSITFNGLDPIVDPKTVQQTLGYLPESLPVYPEMLVVDYLDYAAALKGIDASQRRAEITRVVHETDILSKLLEPISTLSRGYKQRVGVAQAILGKPSLLILDEPTNGLDPSQTEQMRHLIQALARSATVILSTHIMQEVDAVCDRVLILRHGKLVVDAKLEELRDSKELRLLTSMDRKSAEENLTKVEGVREVQAGPEDETSKDGKILSYRLKLTDAADANQVSALVARAIHAAGADLYRLQPEQHDLETLFREVNQSAPVAVKELEHAA
jgi:ABC-2 type transport system ATP-binding protein